MLSIDNSSLPVTSNRPAASLSSILHLKVKHASSVPLHKSDVVGGIDIEIGELLQRSENTSGAFKTYIAYHHLTNETILDIVLDLKGSSGHSHLGSLVVKFQAITQTEAGNLAMQAAKDDIDTSDINRSANMGDSTAVQAMDAIQGVPQNDFVNALANVISKLDMFVQLVDNLAQVSRQTYASYELVSHISAGSSICYHRLADGNFSLYSTRVLQRERGK